MEILLHQSPPPLKNSTRVLILIKSFSYMLTPPMNKKPPSWISCHIIEFPANIIRLAPTMSRNNWRISTLIRDLCISTNFNSTRDASAQRNSFLNSCEYFIFKISCLVYSGARYSNFQLSLFDENHHQ